MHGYPARPRVPGQLRAGSPALISGPQTPPHVRLQRSYFRPCTEPSFNNSRVPLPRAIPGKLGSRGYNLRGKGLRPSNSTPPMPTPLCCTVFQQSPRRYFSAGHATMSASLALAPCNAPRPAQGQVFTDLLCLPWVQARALWGCTNPVPSAAAPLGHSFAQHPAPKGGGSTHVLTPRAMTAVFLSEEHPRDCQPASHRHVHPRPSSPWVR